MPRKREHIPISKRKRALYSCDRCKQRKRACKRYQEGVRKFDNITPCEECVKSNSECITKLFRKKRSYISVSETTLIQFKCLTLIIKAIFPETDPSNLEHIKNVAKALYVKLPNYETGDLLNEIENGNCNDERLLCGQHTSSNSYDENVEVEDESEYITDAKHIETLSSGSSDNQNETQMCLGGADRLFNALLKVGKVASNHELKYLENMGDRKYIPANLPLLINGSAFHHSLLLDLIPHQECEMYTNVFFSRLHQSYFIFNETTFRKRHTLFLQHAANKALHPTEKFCNEEICSIYLVWILGRNCYLTKLIQVDDPSKANIVPNSTIDKYTELINMCLSGCFYSNNIHCVRMLYLLSLYNSAIRNTDSAWHLLSNCCLKCFGMGFNRNAVLSKFEESEKEDIKVVWWSSFKLHMNNCAIKGRLPNISLYDVDLDLPKLEHVNDKLFRDAYTKSIELFKIMFNILKNREYLTKSRNPWCKENLRNVIKINISLKMWESSLGYSLKYYKRPNPKRYQIKLHLQYYYCSISLIAPYLIAYALNPERSFDPSSGIIDTLCDGVNSAIQLMEVINFSVNSGYCNGLLHYDLFYSYNALMILLLGYTLIKEKPKEKYCENYNTFTETLLQNFDIDMKIILKVIGEIRDINNYYGSGAVGTMKDFSNNISILLNYFQLNEDPNTLEAPGPQDPESNLDAIFKTTADNSAYTGEEEIQCSARAGNVTLMQTEHDFFDFINFVNTENDEESFFSDQLLLDWKKLFGTSGSTNKGHCDHQF